VGESGAKLRPDFDLYRAGFPDRLSASPTYLRIYGDNEELSSFHAVYGIPSYGGYVNAVPRAYSSFLEGMIPPAVLYKDFDVRNGFVSHLKDTRLLDLLGVRYVPSSTPGRVRERPGALARFQFFTAFEVVGTGRPTFERLREASFDPQREIVLDRAPGIDSRGGASMPIRPLVHSPDQIEIPVGGKGPGILLFNDSFHPGWHAFVDGEEARVMRANGNFLAVAVHADARRVEWRFEPWAFSLAIKISVLGLVMFAAGLFFLGGRKALSPEAVSLSPKAPVPA
jgi:hypothetical protein